jgi:hypothetical protein
MTGTQFVIASAHRRMLGIASLMLSTLGAQTLQLAQSMQRKLVSAAGDYLVLTELPKPEWQEEFGAPVARLRMETQNAVAWRIGFRSLSLTKGSQMFLYGVDHSGSVRTVHGPYEGNGPLNIPDFESQVIEGTGLLIQLRGGEKTNDWPFELESVKSLDSVQLRYLRDRGVQIQSAYRPQRSERNASELRTVWFDNRLVYYQVIDEMAVMEGDIVLGPAAQVEGAIGGKSNGTRASHDVVSESLTQYRWPNGRVPYTIQHSSTGITVGSTLEANILGAISHWNHRFPGILYSRNGEADYVTFRYANIGVCQSNIGRVGGQQFVELDDGCSQGAVVHEIGHALGLIHEHTRPDRDTYVKILWYNIEPGRSSNFQIPAVGTSRELGNYDYGSIMHYSTTALGCRGLTTIQLLQAPPAGVVVGQRSGLSAGDEAGIRSRYCDPVYWGLPTSVDVDFYTQSHSLSVSAPPYCSWTVTEAVSWITLTGTTTKTGSDKFTYSVTSNTGPTKRIGFIHVNGKAIEIRQETAYVTDY